jgi:hypothetical protein
MLFAHLKRILRLGRLRLRGPCAGGRPVEVVRNESHRGAVKGDRSSTECMRRRYAARSFGLQCTLPAGAVPPKQD